MDGGLRCPLSELTPKELRGSLCLSLLVLNIGKEICKREWDKGVEVVIKIFSGENCNWQGLQGIACSGTTSALLWNERFLFFNDDCNCSFDWGSRQEKRKASSVGKGHFVIMEFFFRRLCYKYHTCFSESGYLQNRCSIFLWWISKQTKKDFKLSITEGNTEPHLHACMYTCTNANTYFVD